MANYLSWVSGKLSEVAAIVTSAGAGDAGKIPALDSGGHLDSTVMPTGIGAETLTITTSEALSAGDVVNIWVSSGTKVRKADATTVGKEAHGFVLSSASSGGSATVYFEGSNTGVTGLTVGANVYLSTTAGLVTGTCPTGTGNNMQQVGVATSATSFSFSPQLAVTKL